MRFVSTIISPPRDSFVQLILSKRILSEYIWLTILPPLMSMYLMTLVSLFLTSMRSLINPPRTYSWVRISPGLSILDYRLRSNTLHNTPCGSSMDNNLQGRYYYLTSAGRPTSVWSSFVRHIFTQIIFTTTAPDGIGHLYNAEKKSSITNYLPAI